MYTTTIYIYVIKRMYIYVKVSINLLFFKHIPKSKKIFLAIQTGQPVTFPLTACHQIGHRLPTGVKDVHHRPPRRELV